MALRTYKPVTPGLRQLVLVDHKELHKGKPFKPLTVGLTSTGGRNNLGRVTIRHRGGGHKRTYRLIDFKRREHLGVPGTVERIEYDPNRTAYIALVRYLNGKYAYILAPHKLSAGDKVIADEVVDVKLGNAGPIGNIPVGTLVHNIEFKIGKGGGLARSAGSYAQIVGRDQGYVILRLSSGEQRLIHGRCFASIGSVSNVDHMNESLSKAGRNRWKGRRPSVRGVAMNPIDHPHGGGAGKTSGGRNPVTPWGICTKGKKTRTNKRTDVFILSSRHKNKK